MPTSPDGGHFQTIYSIRGKYGIEVLANAVPLGYGTSEDGHVPREVDVLAQGDGDLGARMRRAFDDLFARGARGVVLVGSDLPGLSAAVVRGAVETLDARAGCVVLGPAEDGGYYLIGATRTPAVLLAGIEWSTADVLASTEARARQSGLETVRLPIGRDIDSLADLATVPPGAVRTQQWLRRHAPDLSHEMTRHAQRDG